jgi:hypothetical protein
MFLSTPDSLNTQKVLLVGWDAADWKVINPLLEAGRMPNLARFLEQGVKGNIATLQPALSPTLWTSIATGKRPDKHGILGFSEPDPVTGGIRPITNLSRKTKAIWNILNQEGKNTITVGWWPSNPAEPLSKGAMVSNDYQNAHGQPDSWPLKPGTIHPERLIRHLKDLRFHPSELDENDLRPFLPGIEGMSREELDKLEKDPRIQSLMKIIADCTSVHSAATALIQNEPWDLMCVYYDAIDHFGHVFNIYENPPADIQRIPSWDEVPGDHGMHPPDKQISAADSKAALDQLVALGYIEEPDADQSKAIEQTVRELDYNLAQAWIDGGYYSEAVAILERLFTKWPMEHRFGFKLATHSRQLLSCSQTSARDSRLLWGSIRMCLRSGLWLKNSFRSFSPRTWVLMTENTFSTLTSSRFLISGFHKIITITVRT